MLRLHYRVWHCRGYVTVFGIVTVTIIKESRFVPTGSIPAPRRRRCDKCRQESTARPACARGSARAKCLSTTGVAHARWRSPHATCHVTIPIGIRLFMTAQLERSTHMSGCRSL
eukprot:8397442-Pyramimonas_sp.AAC.3